MTLRWKKPRVCGAKPGLIELEKSICESSSGRDIIWCICALLDLVRSGEIQKDELALEYRLVRLLKEYFYRRNRRRLQIQAMRALDFLCTGKGRTNFCAMLFDADILANLTDPITRYVRFGRGENRTDVQIAFLQYVPSFLLTLVEHCPKLQQELTINAAVFGMTQLIKDICDAVAAPGFYFYSRLVTCYRGDQHGNVLTSEDLGRPLEILRVSSDPASLLNILDAMTMFVKLEPQLVLDNGILRALERVLLCEELKNETRVLCTAFTLLIEENDIWRNGVVNDGEVSLIVRAFKGKDVDTIARFVPLVTGLVRTATRDHVSILIHNGIIPELTRVCSYWTLYASSTLLQTLEVLKVCLDLSKQMNYASVEIGSATRWELFSQLRKLLDHVEQDINNAAKKIFDRHYTLSDGEI